MTDFEKQLISWMRKINTEPEAFETDEFFAFAKEYRGHFSLGHPEHMTDERFRELRAIAESGEDIT